MRGKGKEESREDKNFGGRSRYHKIEREVEGEEEIFLLFLPLMRAHARMERSDNMQLHDY